MATLSWTSVQPWLSVNPHNIHLIPFKNASTSVEGLPELQGIIDGWTKQPVHPATPLSAVLLAQDPIFSSLNEGARRTIIREEVTDMQEKSILMLKGRQWPIRRTSEGIVAVGLEEGRSWPELGWTALCALRECQIITLNEDKKIIKFFPEDVRTWSVNTEVLIMDHEVRYLHKQAPKFQLCLWLSQKEVEGYIISWPLAEGSMVELKEKAEKLHQSIHGKVVKEQLCKRVGKAEGIHHLTSWILV